MELRLERQYLERATNGVLYSGNEKLGYTIELPWKDNAKQVSCIPEGRYRLVRRKSKKYGDHFLVKDVPNRQLILIHPANDAVKELKGCIAPVTLLVGEGKGLYSKKALAHLYAVIGDEPEVYLTIIAK